MTSHGGPGSGAAALSEPPGSESNAAGSNGRRQEEALARLSPEAVQLLIAASVYREPVDLGALLSQLGRQDRSAAREQISDLRTAAGASGPAAAGPDASAPRAGNGTGNGAAVALRPRAEPRSPTAGASREGSSDGAPPGLAVLMIECATAGLLTVEPLPAAGQPALASQPVAVFVAQTAAIELQSYLAKKRRGMEVTAAHRRAADYWLSRVASLQQDRKADVHDLLEARHHLLAADDARQAEAVTQGVCDQLHAAGEFDSEAALIRDTLIWLPYESPRRAAWVHALGRAAQMQGDNSAARLYRQALDLFSQLGDSTGIASVSQDLDVLSQARRDSAHGDAVRREAARARPGKESAARTDSAWQDADWTDPGDGDLAWQDAGQAYPSDGDPVRQKADRTSPEHPDLARQDADRTDPGHPGLARQDADRTDPGHRDQRGLDSAGSGAVSGPAGPDYAAAIASIPALPSPVAIETMKPAGIAALPARLPRTGGPQFTGREPLGAYPPIMPGWGERPAEHANPAGWWRWPALVAVLIMTAGLATLMASPSRTGSRGEAGQLRAEGRLTLSSATALRRQVATWIASQISRDAIVSCDPAMCGVLQSFGRPAGCLLVLRPSTPDPLGSDVVVATQAVRAQFGSRLAAVYAPSVLATVGSGSSQIQIRTVAPDGAAAYRKALRADLIARRQAAAQLLRNPHITFSAASRAQLAAGLADSRLLITLVMLAESGPVSVIALGGSAPGEGAGVPLHWAEVGPGPPASGHTAGSGSSGHGGYRSGNFQSAVLRFLRSQLPPFLPASATAQQLANGLPVVHIDFAAPSPLGLLGQPGTGIGNPAVRHAHPRVSQKRPSQY